MRSGVSLSQIADPDTWITNHGDPVHLIYSPLIRDGRVVLEVSGKEDIPTLINAYRDQTDMSYIIARLTAGDSSVLGTQPLYYGDFSSMSYDRLSMFNILMDAQHAFDHLDQSIKSKFENSFQQWFVTAGTSDWSAKMTGSPDPVDQPAVHPVDQPVSASV